MTARVVEGGLLGIDGQLDEQTVRQLIGSLTTLWILAAGQPVGRLEDDLNLSRRWFDPVAQGQRLRRELSRLPIAPENVPDPGTPFTMVVADRTFLVTPEGRCVLDLLEKLEASGRYRVDEGVRLPYERKLALLYRDWGRHRLNSVVSLLQGTTMPLQISAAGVLVALLVNRCTTEERALTRFRAGRKRDIVDRAFFAAVEAFSSTLSLGRVGKSNDPRLVSGWMLYEAKRRVGDDLVISDAKSKLDGRVWIRPEAEASVIHLVAKDLQRGHRTRAAPEIFSRAYDALVESLREELPALAALGLVHQRPMDTKLLKQRFASALHHSEMDTE